MFLPFVWYFQDTFLHNSEDINNILCTVFHVHLICILRDKRIVIQMDLTTLKYEIYNLYIIFLICMFYSFNYKVGNLALLSLHNIPIHTHNCTFLFIYYFLDIKYSFFRCKYNFCNSESNFCILIIHFHSQSEIILRGLVCNKEEVWSDHYTQDKYLGQYHNICKMSCILILKEPKFYVCKYDHYQYNH